MEVDTPVVESSPVVEIAPLPEWASFGLDSADSSDPSPPLPADAAPESGAEAEEQPTVAAAKGQSDAPVASAAQQQEAGAPDQKASEPAAGADDPELSTEDNATVKSLPEAERPAATDKYKAASIWTQISSLDKPVEEVRQHIQEKVQPERYAQLESSFVNNALADADHFAAKLFKDNPEQYGKLAVAAFKADPAYFLQAATGKETSPEQLTQALDFYEQHKDQAGHDSGLSVLSDDEFEELLEYADEDVAEAARAERAAAKAAARQPKPAEKPAEAEAKAPEAEAQAPEQIIEAYQNEQREIVQTRVSGLSHVESYLDRKAGEKLGLSVSATEREKAPEVAMLKDLKSSLIFDGLGEALPNFTLGMLEWAKERPEFQEKIATFNEASQRKDKSAAERIAKEMIPLADKYFDERLRHPVFRLLDKLLTEAVKNGNPPTPKENHIPGSANSQPPSPHKLSLDEQFLLDAARL